MGEITLNLSAIMGEHRIKQRQLAEAAGLRPAAVNALYNGKRQRVDLGQLAAILSALEVLTGQPYDVADLLKFRRETPAPERI